MIFELKKGSLIEKLTLPDDANVKVLRAKDEIMVPDEEAVILSLIHI